MRAVRAFLAAPLCLLAACGDGDVGTLSGAERGAPADPAFSRWPEGTTVAVRLPPPHVVADRPDAFAALVRGLGREGTTPSAFLYGADATDGAAADVSPLAALTGEGGWLRVLPAADMAAMRRAFAALPPDVVAQESQGLLVLSRGTLPGGKSEPPLPKGDLALRVRHHPLLAFVAESSDVLEAAIDLGALGLEARARLLPGPDSPTASLLARAAAGTGGLVDFLPASAFLRIETTLPSVFPAAPLSRRLARHAGIAEEKDRVVVERLLREALTGADAGTGLAIGLEARGGELTVVVVARDADGPPSPILRKLREEERSSFGSLILDRREAPKGLVGWAAWAAQAQPQIEDLPECLYTSVGLLADEAKGLPVALAAFGGWSVVAVGPRADSLALGAKARLEGGGSRSPGAADLRQLREGGGEYVVGVVLEPASAELPEADLAALRALFGWAEGARGPKSAAVAGFRTPEGLSLKARVRY